MKIFGLYFDWYAVKTTFTKCDHIMGVCWPTRKWVNMSNVEGMLRDYKDVTVRFDFCPVCSKNIRGLWKQKLSGNSKIPRYNIQLLSKV